MGSDQLPAARLVQYMINTHGRPFAADVFAASYRCVADLLAMSDHVGEKLGAQPVPSCQGLKGHQAANSPHSLTLHPVVCLCLLQEPSLLRLKDRLQTAAMASDVILLSTLGWMTDMQVQCRKRSNCSLLMTLDWIDAHIP